MQNLFVGDQSDYEANISKIANWYVIHACKDPYHRNLLGYSGKGAPKQHPEYLLARRENQLFLNLVDAADPAYIPKKIIDTALRFIEEAQSKNTPLLLHCNLGESRSPSIGLIYLAIKNVISNSSLEAAETAFRMIYPNYNPKSGMRGFLEQNWENYVGN
ncbi:phosphatase [Leptospira koniambonensis]|nr:phosphatase [Leptospira koniambonensis]